MSGGAVFTRNTRLQNKKSTEESNRRLITNVVQLLPVPTSSVGERALSGTEFYNRRRDVRDRGRFFTSDTISGAAIAISQSFDIISLGASSSVSWLNWNTIRKLYL